MNKKELEEKVFHDTKLLLENYRNVVWSLCICKMRRVKP